MSQVHTWYSSGQVKARLERYRERSGMRISLELFGVTGLVSPSLSGFQFLLDVGHLMSRILSIFLTTVPLSRIFPIPAEVLVTVLRYRWVPIKMLYISKKR